MNDFLPKGQQKISTQKNEAMLQNKGADHLETDVSTSFCSFFVASLLFSSTYAGTPVFVVWVHAYVAIGHFSGALANRRKISPYLSLHTHESGKSLPDHPTVIPSYADLSMASPFCA